MLQDMDAEKVEEDSIMGTPANVAVDEEDEFDDAEYSQIFDEATLLLNQDVRYARFNLPSKFVKIAPNADNLLNVVILVKVMKVNLVRHGMIPFGMALVYHSLMAHLTTIVRICYQMTVVFN